MEGKKLGVKDIVSSSLQIGKGLKTMHDNNWVHFDIKPANILLKAKTGEIDARLMDFDYARDLSKVSDETLINSTGTLGYISPELMRGECYGPKGAYENDIFGLGVTLLENSGINLWTMFSSRPESIKIEQNEGYDALCLSFQKVYPCAPHTHRYRQQKTQAPGLFLPGPLSWPPAYIEFRWRAA